jgi:GNAT superfamily N-acetyltransferase
MSSLELEVSTDPTRIDVELVHDFLRSSYWAQGRPRAVVERSLQNSLCFGGYAAGKQVAFGRVITDRAVFGYIADVFVVPEWRGRGFAKVLVQAMIDHPDLAGLPVMLLRTRDAHGLYAKLGFSALPRPKEMMVRYGSR